MTNRQIVFVLAGSRQEFDSFSEYWFRDGGTIFDTLVPWHPEYDGENYDLVVRTGTWFRIPNIQAILWHVGNSNANWILYGAPICIFANSFSDFRGYCYEHWLNEDGQAVFISENSPIVPVDLVTENAHALWDVTPARRLRDNSFWRDQEMFCKYAHGEPLHNPLSAAQKGLMGSIKKWLADKKGVGIAWPEWLKQDDRDFLDEQFPIHYSLQYKCITMLKFTQQGKNASFFVHHMHGNLLPYYLVWKQKIKWNIAIELCRSYDVLYRLCGAI